MNELQIFENPKFGNVRTLTEDGKTLFCGSDVAKALGYKNPSKALSSHCKGVTKRYTPTPSGQQEMNFITQGDVYRLAARSTLPGADEFERWIFDEVLPSIFKTGGYTVPGTPAKTIEDLTAAVQRLTERLDAQEARQKAFLPASPLALPGGTESSQQDFGPVARKRWMRTVNEKLDLLSTKLNIPHNIVLSQIYGILEDQWGANLEEEQLRCAAAQNMFSCSVLFAISCNEGLRDGFQKIVDRNLAPENRGW